MNSLILLNNKKEKRFSKLVEFVYKKDSGEISWRKINLTNENFYFVKGFDLEDENKFKTFKKESIIGQRLIDLKS